MKKYLSYLFYLIFFVVIAATNSEAQSVITEHKVKFLDAEQNALVIVINTNAEDVTNALLKKLKSEGVKAQEKKGMINCTESNWSAIGNGTLDYYFKITKMDKDKTELAFFISKGYTNFLTSESDKITMDNARNFLANLVIDVRKFQIQRALDEQAKKIKLATQEQEKLLQTQKKFQDQLEEVNKRLANNKDDQLAKSKELENLQNQLKELQAKMDELK
jgi:hypothetical protein